MGFLFSCFVCWLCWASGQAEENHDHAELLQRKTVNVVTGSSRTGEGLMVESSATGEGDVEEFSTIGEGDVENSSGTGGGEMMETSRTGERVTSIKVERICLHCDHTGRMDHKKEVTIGESSQWATSTSVDATISAAYKMGALKTSGSLSTAWSHSRSGAQHALSVETRNIECSQFYPQPCYVYQCVSTITTDTGKIYISRGNLEVSDKPLVLVHETIPIYNMGKNMAEVTLEIVQPDERKGYYPCRSKTENVCDLLSRNGGCRSVDDFVDCSPGDGWKPFKWGSHAYMGGIDMPEGVCVTYYRNWGRCNTNVIGRKQCAVGAKRRIMQWGLKDHNQRICSFQLELMPGFYCPGHR